jgi:hypothetical protein
MDIHHACENKNCVELLHLEMMAHKDHMRHHLLKRPLVGQRTGPNTDQWRSRLSDANKSLTVTQVRDIKILLAFGVKGKWIAERYKIAASTVSNIKNEKNYKEVTI